MLSCHGVVHVLVMRDRRLTHHDPIRQDLPMPAGVAAQYPNEEEILMPPLTALEVARSRIEGAVVVVELRPAMQASTCGLKTGAEDLERLEREREASERAAAEAREAADREAEAERRRLEYARRQAAWQKSMVEARFSASQRKAAVAVEKLARKNEAIARARWKRASEEQACACACASEEQACAHACAHPSHAAHGCPPRPPL